jgi:hypothetical protein
MVAAAIFNGKHLSIALAIALYDACGSAIELLNEKIMAPLLGPLLFSHDRDYSWWRRSLITATFLLCRRTSRSWRDDKGISSFCRKGEWHSKSDHQRFCTNGISLLALFGSRATLGVSPSRPIEWNHSSQDECHSDLRFDVRQVVRNPPWSNGGPINERRIASRKVSVKPEGRTRQLDDPPNSYRLAHASLISALSQRDGSDGKINRANAPDAVTIASDHARRTENPVLCGSDWR